MIKLNVNLKSILLSKITVYMRSLETSLKLSSEESKQLVWSTLKRIIRVKSFNEPIYRGELNLNDITLNNEYFCSCYSKSTSFCQKIESINPNSIISSTSEFTLWLQRSCRCIFIDKFNFGSDSIYPCILKLYNPVITPYITHILNCCL